MPIIGYNESSLTDSEVFKGINEMGAVSQKDKAINLIKNAQILTPQDIEGAYVQVKQYPNTLSRTAVKAFENGKIVLLYNTNPASRMTQAIPFLTFLKGKSHITYIFMDRYVSTSRDGVLSIQSSLLHDLLISAIVANALKDNYAKLVNSMYLQKMLTTLYTKFMTRIINRDYSVAADKQVYDIVNYWIGKFFLYNIFQSVDSKDGLEKLLSNNFKYIDEIKYSEIRKTYELKDPKNLTGLMELLKEATPRMNSLTLPSFMSSWIDYYYISSLLAMDNVEYLIFMILCLLGGNNIISVAATEMVKDTRGITSFKEELIKIL